jgi:hypothetical protein
MVSGGAAPNAKAPAIGSGLFTCHLLLVAGYFIRVGLARLNLAAAAAYQGSFSKHTGPRLGFALRDFFCFVRVGISGSLVRAPSYARQTT